MKQAIKKKMGRPRKELKWDEFDKLCALQCTEVEICQWFDMTTDTLEARIAEKFPGQTFSEIFAQKRGTGRIALRRAQFQAAKRGNATLLIWLGKQWLEQRDKHEIDAHHVVTSKEKGWSFDWDAYLRNETEQEAPSFSGANRG